MFDRSLLWLLFSVLLGVSPGFCAIEVVVDNDAGAPGYVEVGSWNEGGSPGYLNGGYRYTQPVSGAPTHSATWTPDLPERRQYEVYAAFRQSTNRSIGVPVTIVHAEGETTISLNQNGENQVVERYLGEFLFDAGVGGSVRFDNNAEAGVVIADAIIWREVVDPKPAVGDITWSPLIPGDMDPMTDTVHASDNGSVSTVEVCYWDITDGTENCITGTPNGDGSYTAIIPGQPTDTIVGFYVKATDNLDQETKTSATYYRSGPLLPFLEDVVVDNDDGPPGYMETGNWIMSASTGYAGGSYRYVFAVPGEPTDTATWVAEIPRIGVYEVYATFLAGDNRTAGVPVTITHADGEDTVSMNQQGSGFVEVFLGQYPFEPGGTASVRVDNNGGDGAVISDAMIWRMPTDPLPAFGRVKREPVVPQASESIQVTAEISDNVSVMAARVRYTTEPGGIENVLAMYDDGAHGDGAPNDGLYGGVIPGQDSGTTVAIQVEAEDNLGQVASSNTQRFVVGSDPHHVYIVLSSDTSVWGVSGYPGVARWTVFESRTGVLSRVYDPAFRYQVVDSLGRPFKITWFMHGGAWFRTAVNSTHVSGTYHFRKNWDTEIKRWGDPLEYHFHHYVYDGEWKMAPTFEETIPEYEYLMSQMMLDEELFITSFRSGWNYMDNGYQQYLERWVPFRMEGVRSGWVPYHPSFDDYKVPGDMKGWEVRHHYTKGVSENLARQILAAATSGTDQVVCIWSHQNESDFPEQLIDVSRNFHAAQADYPEVQFHYLAAKEAMQTWLEHDSQIPPPLDLDTSIEVETVSVEIRTADDIYQEQPWVAARRYTGEYERLETVKTGLGEWTFAYSTDVYDKVAVGVSDEYGNENLKTVDDGSQRWAIQSDFIRALPVDMDLDTSPTCAMLRLEDESYIPSGSLTFDHRLDEGTAWETITVDVLTPPQTSIRYRYKTAEEVGSLDSVTWNPYITERIHRIPPGNRDTLIRIEVLLEGTPEVTPGLHAIEVTYGRGSSSRWMLY